VPTVCSPPADEAPPANVAEYAAGYLSITIPEPPVVPVEPIPFPPPPPPPVLIVPAVPTP